MSSLLRDHANLPCIIPILEYVLPKQTQGNLKKKEHPTTTHTHTHTHTFLFTSLSKEHYSIGQEEQTDVSKGLEWLEECF